MLTKQNDLTMSLLFCLYVQDMVLLILRNIQDKRIVMWLKPAFNDCRLTKRTTAKVLFGCTFMEHKFVKLTCAEFKIKCV